MYSLTTQFISLDTLDHRPHGHKTFEYEFGIRTPKSSIQKSVFYGIWCFDWMLFKYKHLYSKIL